MRRQRVLSFAVSCCIICSIICGRTYASGIWTVDGNVDPWADLEELERFGGGQAVSDDVDRQPGDSAAAPSAPESEPPALEAPPDVSAQQGGEEEDEPVFDGFGFSATMADGSIQQSVLSSDFGLFSETISSFQLELLSGATFYSRFRDETESSWRSTYSGTMSFMPTSFSGRLEKFFATGNSNFYGSGWYRGYSVSASSVSFVLWFDGVTGEIDTVSLAGALNCQLNACAVTGASTPDIALAFTVYNYNPSSAHLVCELPGSSSLVNLAALPISGYSVQFDGNPVSVAREVNRIGIRFVMGGLPTSVISTKTTSQISSAVSWRFLMSLGNDFSGFYDTPKTEGEITNGLLGGLIEWVKSIYEAVVSLPENFGKLLADIAQLPGKILDGIKSLFIPSEEDMTELSDKYNGLFEEKLGFVYQMFTFIVDTFGDLVDELSSGNAYSFVFPGIRFPMNGETVEILPETSVSLDNALMDVLRPVLGTAVSIVCVFALVSTGFDMVVAVISGASYFAFLGNRKEEEK